MEEEAALPFELNDDVLPTTADGGNRAADTCRPEALHMHG